MLKWNTQEQTALDRLRAITSHWANQSRNDEDPTDTTPHLYPDCIKQARNNLDEMTALRAEMETTIKDPQRAKVYFWQFDPHYKVLKRIVEITERDLKEYRHRIKTGGGQFANAITD